MRSCGTHAANEDGCSECERLKWMDAAQTMAAGNARLCEIALKADALVECLEQRFVFACDAKLKKLVEAYKIVRQGS